jgi:hypothetical protein
VWVGAADKHLRGSNRELQFGQFDVGSVGGNDPFATLTPTNPFQLPGQPSQTLNNNPPDLGNNLFTFSTNPGLLQLTDPAETPTFGGSMFDQIFPSPLFLGPPLQASPGSGADDPFPNLPTGFGGGLGFDGSTGSSGCRRSEFVCIAVFDPVICDGGCRYGNSCEAMGAGFAANQCRPD